MARSCAGADRRIPAYPDPVVIVGHLKINAPLTSWEQS